MYLYRNTKDILFKRPPLKGKSKPLSCEVLEERIIAKSPVKEAVRWDCGTDCDHGRTTLDYVLGYNLWVGVVKHTSSNYPANILYLNHCFIKQGIKT